MEAKTNGFANVLFINAFPPLRMSSSVSSITSIPFKIISVKLTIQMQPPFGQTKEYKQEVAFAFKLAANDVLSDKSFREQRKL